MSTVRASSPSKPKVIFLDAVGTLFGIKGSVGSVYADQAAQFSVSADSDQLDRAFYKSFKAASPMAFPKATPTEVPHLEYLWWKKIAAQTFERAGVMAQFADFERFFSQVYHQFSTAAPWVLYPDTLTSLTRWQRLGIELGVISNFDSRLYSVLEALGLSSYFQSVTISAEVGAAKPDRAMFATALQKHSASAGQAWHVGDSYREDFQAAQTAGLFGIWLRR
ncbi:MAG: HAD family hydrolase [Leptolyngbya sp. SIO4C1]|nr:HAD family hydrolase [Leptolyngbya sp. SIO4C1]